MQELSEGGDASSFGNQVESTSDGFKKLIKLRFSSPLRRLVVLIALILFIAVPLFLFFIRKERLTPGTLSKDILKLNEGSFKDASSGSVLKEEDLSRSFLEPLKQAEEYKSENKIDEDFYKYNKYLTVYNQMVGQYYATRDPKILETAKDLRDYIKVNFPDKYLFDEKNNPSIWKIVE